MKKVYLTRETVYIKVIRMRKEKKFTAVSNTVWVDLKAMVTEKTIKEESTDKNYSNDNYSASIYAMHAPSLKILTCIFTAVFLILFY